MKNAVSKRSVRVRIPPCPVNGEQEANKQVTFVPRCTGVCCRPMNTGGCAHKGC
jgi:hypothetical protein